MKSRTNSRPHQTRTNDHQPRTGDSAREHYRREKARRAKVRAPEDDLLAAAKREYLALLEAEAAKGKGGRPKKKPAPTRDETDESDETDETDENDESEEADEE